MQKAEGIASAFCIENNTEECLNAKSGVGRLRFLHLKKHGGMLKCKKRRGSPPLFAFKKTRRNA
jgi:hypothetical protein